MKRILIIVAVVVGLIIAAAAIIPFLIPNEVYRTQIERAATKALGREVTLGGEARLSLFPRISASIENVAVANPADFSDPHMVEAGALRGVVKWGPLLAQRVEIEELAFEDATVKLQRLSDGRANWEFSPTAPETEREDAPTSGGEPGATVSGGIGRIRITNANIFLEDAVAGQSFALESFTGGATLRALDAPLEADGQGRFQNQDFTFELNVDSPEQALSGAPTLMAVIFSSDLASLSFEGDLALGDTPTASGAFSAQAGDLQALADFANMDASAPLRSLGAFRSSGGIAGPLQNPSLDFSELSLSGGLLELNYEGVFSLESGGRIDGQLRSASNDLRGLLNAFGVEPSTGDTLQSFRLSAAPQGTPDVIELADLDFALDDIAATGAAGVDLTGARPKLLATLVMERLDLTPFMGAQDAPAEASEGWSQETLDLAGLKTIDADLDLDVDELVIDKLTLRDAKLTAELRNGALSTNIERLTAFGGAWSGAFGVDASRATPSVSMDLDGSAIAMSEMLNTFAGVDTITGLGALQLNATAEGDSLDAIVKGLNGSVSTNLADGVIKGFDAAGLVRSTSDIRAALASGEFGLALSPDAQTDFANFDSVLTIQNGVARVDALKLLNPVLALDGSGQINLGAQSLDLSILTSIDKAASGEASAIQLNGIPVPIRLKGSWSSPSISPDTRLLQQALTAELQDRVADELSNQLGGILGRPDPADAEEETAEDEPSVEDQLEDAAVDALSGLFGRRN